MYKKLSYIADEALDAFRGQYNVLTLKPGLGSLKVIESGTIR